MTILDATALADLVRRREASPLELVDAAIQRIQSLNPQLNAVVWERFEKAREEARSAELPQGPFTGVPFLTKDLGCTTAGEPDSGGSRFLKENGNIASVTTELARRIKAAGFINLGRTNTPEFGAVATTEPLAWGPTRNPWDTARTAGGSSGGSCAAVASLMVPVAHGSDGGGSIRLPAAACGLVGLKPTRGRVNIWPSTEWVSPVSVQGFQTRTIRDLAGCMDFASGSQPGDPMPPPVPVRPYASEVGADPGQLRIGLWNRLPPTIDGVLHAECQRAVEETGKLLESMGHFVELAHPAVLDDPKTATIFQRIWPVRLLAALQYFERKLEKKAGPDNLDPDTLYWLDRARGVSAQEYVLALEDMDAFTRAFAGWWGSSRGRGYDVLVTPTTGTLTPKLGALGMDPARIKTSALWWPYTAFFNMSGQPAISLPLHWSEENLPVGVQLGAAYAREDVLIRLASQLEQAKPWSGRTPPVHAEG
ncbi:MAG: amidase [Bryobacteraceae bacterium]